MARKKKEEIKAELATPETVAETAPVAVEETTATKSKKTVKKAVKKTAKKPANKTTKTKSKEQETLVPAPVELSEEPKKEQADNTEKAEKKEKPAKAKRGKKVATKKAEEQPLVEEESKKSEPTVIEEQPKKEVKKTVTRAEKNETIKSLIKELLSVRPYKWSELLDESARLYEQRIEEKDGHVANDVRGRVGSVFDVMKKDGEVAFEGGMYALKQNADKKTDENPLVKTEESKPAKEEKAEKVENTEKQSPVSKGKAKAVPVFDMTLLLGDKTKPIKQEQKEEAKQSDETVSQAKTEEKTEVKKPVKTPTKKEKPAPKKATEQKQEKRGVEKKVTRANGNKLKETFLKRIRALGGKYFEYYSIYLLERYSLRNGRRVDGFKISGGDNDGGIDGEIEVTDRIGFKETIYVQAKNWKPIYGKEDSWVIGETALREFIGAVAYRQAKEGKQRCRGIFITTSYFTAGAKEILEQMSDSFVGYDGDDLFEAAKECSFGLIQENGEWKLDERLLASDKAFFNLYD